MSIDLDRDSGNVKVTGNSQQSILDACAHIKTISDNAPDRKEKKYINFEELYKVDDVMMGKIERIADFGAFIVLPEGGEGLLHISKISKQRVSNINDLYKVVMNLKLKY